MSQNNDSTLKEDAQLLIEAEHLGGWEKFRAYLKLSGPGFLQSAITLGGGSLAGSLYLGVLAGTGMLWVQPLAMLLGIIMLSAIAYVTLSTGKRPFEAVNNYVNPVLGWAWAIAAFVANMVWVMPQYTLGIGVFRQNLMPGVFGPEGILPGFLSNLILAVTFFAVAVAFTWNYGRGGVGVKFFELLMKVMVALIVLSFFGVVVRLTFEPGALNWGAVFKGFIPNPAMILRPAEGFAELLANIPQEYQGYWADHIVGEQRGVIVSTAATAVGINMTFLFGYSLLKRRWGKEFRGFMKFDLGFGMLIPFLLATACVVIASASQFHRVPQHGLVDVEEMAQVEQALDSDVRRLPEHVTASAGQRALFERLLLGRAYLTMDGEAASAVQSELETLREKDVESYGAQVEAIFAEHTTPFDRYIAATLVRRDNFDLANALTPLLGGFFSQIIFGIGVLGAAFSTITMLMIISGVGFCEFVNKPHGGWWFRVGALAPVTGVFAPFWWADAAPWLVVPTSVFGFVLIPLAYISFFLLMNQRTLLGKEMPKGRSRLAWNTLMGIALIIIVPSSLYMLNVQYGAGGMSFAALLVAAAVIVHFIRPPRPLESPPESSPGDSD